MSDLPEIRLAAEEVRGNFIRTVILLLMMVGIIFLLAWLLGIFISNHELGYKIGFLICLIIIPLQIMSAKFMITSLCNCYQLDLEDPAEKKALRVIEGIAISAGLSKVPEVYIMETDIPNAFTAGWNENSAYIVITTGLLNNLTDSELEGVIAHEIAHIVSRDIMIVTMAISLNTAVLLLAVLVWVASLIDAIISRNQLSLFLALLLIPLTFIISLLLKINVSRQREYAADALAVRLCSYNQGLISALEKLSKVSYSDKAIEELGGKELEPLYFSYSADSIFTTHPPIQERIARLKNMY